MYFRSLNFINKKFLYWSFLFKKPLIEKNVKVEINPVLIFTIAYNDASLIDKQIFLLNKYSTNSFKHIIIDNSTNLLVRKSIEVICQSYNVGYVSIPKNPYSNNKSHAAAMHWAYFNIIRPSKCEVFGFLDHDIFPIAPYSIMDKMNNGIYGRVMHAYHNHGYHSNRSLEHPYWSLWAGFCFFNRELIKGAYPWSLNFFSKHFANGDFLDTGGGLWGKIYSKIPYPEILAKYKLQNLNDDYQDEEIQNQKIEILDDAWIHFISLSNWRKVKNLDEKKYLLDQLLKPHLT